MKFYLGTHHPHWLKTVDVPLFISAVRLRGRKSFPRAVGRWSLDSGGFMTIRQHGYYPTKPSEYAKEVRRWRDEIGGLDWAAIQDWMCEDVMLKKTGKSIEQHQYLTIGSYLALNACDGELPWIPILQGQTVDDYHRHADLWEQMTCVRLDREPTVGLGSVCRRQGTKEAGLIVRSLFARGIRGLHGFGVKTLGLTGKDSYAPYLKSADSLAWSFQGRNDWKFFGVQSCQTSRGKLRELRRVRAAMAGTVVEGD